MLGRAVRLIAATAVLTVTGLSAASAGGWGYGGYGHAGYGFGGYGYGFGNGCCSAPPVVNWGCGNTCAPVRWGCGNPCGNGYGYGYGSGYGYGNGYGNGYGYQQPIYVTTQGPTYQPPLTGYTYPVASYDQPQPYPYVSGGYGYRRAYRPAYRHRYAGPGYPSMRRSYYTPRRGYYRAIELPPK
jgi:hypothetical protein